MENIAEKLNLVIEYIESHLAETIEPKIIEKIACCSYYDIGRIFSLIADINISDYVRKRRLTLAGAELKYDNAKVIDVALKYGYDSPVFFARAFQSFHGFNPSLANKSGAVLNVFPRLAYQISVKGVMDVLNKDKITINGKEYEASYFGEQDMSWWSDYATKREFWRLENANNTFEKCEKCNDVLPYNNYPPIKIEIGQVFVIDYHTRKGTIDRRYYIADGTIWQGMPSTRQFVISEQ
ncbi:MAG: helix-turn-helix domain-containing protein [Clostridia bacterium]|nr:helix-turn-helix domain-containing protein [Clostridia bacterium]